MTKENVTKYLVATKNNNVDILEAEGTATGLMIKFKLNKSVDENIISKVKLIDKDGREYRTDRPASIDVANGSNIVKITFEASKFDNVDRFDFVIENVDGKDEVVKLAKE